MFLTPNFELPFGLRKTLKKAIRLEWITIAYLLSVVVIMYMVMGSSQAMKTAWLEDSLSLLPAIAFLIATKYYDKQATNTFPYGYHRVFSIAFLTGSVALFSMGCYLAIDSSTALIKMERPTIGSTIIFGHQVWLGWVMILVLCYSAFPAMWLGHKKLPYAKKLHNKILYTDAATQKADYLTAFAAIVGILGVGIGWWWADAAAALFISISVVKDGVENLKNAVADLMDRRPMGIKSKNPDPLVHEVKTMIESWSWVEVVQIRFREHGQVYFGEIYIIAKPLTDTNTLLPQAVNEIKNYHWKIHDVVISLVPNNSGLKN